MFILIYEAKKKTFLFFIFILNFLYEFNKIHDDPGLVKLIETTVRSENCRSPKRPIYLVGESLGACLALAVASRNPRIDLVLVLSNPGNNFFLLILILSVVGLGPTPEPLECKFSYRTRSNMMRIEA